MLLKYGEKHLIDTQPFLEVNVIIMKIKIVDVFIIVAIVLEIEMITEMGVGTVVGMAEDRGMVRDKALIPMKITNKPIIIQMLPRNGTFTMQVPVKEKNNKKIWLMFLVIVILVLLTY